MKNRNGDLGTGKKKGSLAASYGTDIVVVAIIATAREG